MLVGCSSTTFAINNAYSDIASGLANTILVINPELTSPHNDFTLIDVLNVNSTSSDKLPLIVNDV